MSGPKQYVTVNGIQIPTEEFIKNREAILARAIITKKEAGQMQNIAQAKFDKELEKAKELSDEKQPETPVPTVSETTTLPSENVEVDNVPVEEEIVAEKVKKKVEWKKKK